MDWRHHMIWIPYGRKLKDALIASNAYQKVCVMFSICSRFHFSCHNYFLSLFTQKSEAKIKILKQNIKENLFDFNYFMNLEQSI